MPASSNTFKITLLSAVAKTQQMSEGSPIPVSLQQNSILQEASDKLGKLTPGEEQVLLTVWYDLFRSGHLSWGDNLSNPDPPHFHLTEQGRSTLQHLSRDPANPDGYKAHLSRVGKLNSITISYVDEALQSYAANCFRAAAVMLGAAAESVALDVRNIVREKIIAEGRTPAKNLTDWRMSRMLGALSKEFEMKQKDMPPELFGNFQAYWPAFTQQIRLARNEAGHPANVDPVRPETVHAGLLIFPELAALAMQLMDWTKNHYE